MRCSGPFGAIVISALALVGGASFLSAAPGHSSESTQAANKSSSQSASAAQSSTPAKSGTAAQTIAPAGRAPVWRGSQVSHFSSRADMYYSGVWGVGDLRVKVAESGELIRFDYRVLDPAKAAALNNKKFEPQLLDAQAKVKLVVPEMEKVGKLRQSSTPKAGMTYWMAFSNPTLAVKRGHRVDVVIGSFHATNLVVE